MPVQGPAASLPVQLPANVPRKGEKNDSSPAVIQALGTGGIGTSTASLRAWMPWLAHLLHACMSQAAAA